MQIVAEKTGYPTDMLDLDLDLEADLGVDTVKQAEMFAEVRAAYNIPRDENLKLRDFPTLTHMIQFARERRSGAAVVSVPVPVETSPQAPAAAPTVSKPPFASRLRPATSFEAADQIPRRVPVPSLRPLLNLCKPTGVMLGEGSRVVLMPDQAGVGAALTQESPRLRRGSAADRAGSGCGRAGTCLKQWLAAGPIQGVFWLSGLDDEGQTRYHDRHELARGVTGRVKSLYTTMRVLYEQIAAPGTFLVSATTLGGQHGYDPAGAVAPMGGAVVGFTKTYKRERAEVLVKAIDFQAGRKASEVAGLLIEETLRDPGAVEIGYKNGLRWTVGLQQQSADDGQPGLTLDEGSVFLITGAAGSIVSAITADLATASGGTFYLLDLVPEPDPRQSRSQALCKRQRSIEARPVRAHAGARRASHSGPG